MRAGYRQLLPLTLLCLGLSQSCAQDVEFQPADGGNGNGGQHPAGCPTDPVFNLLTPVDGEVLTDHVIHYHMEVSGFTLAGDKIGQADPGICEGHLHIFAGAELLEITASTMQDYDIPSEFGSGDEFPFRIVVVHNNHAPIAGIDPIVVNVMKE